MFKKLILATALAITVAGQSFASDLLKMIPEDADFILQLNVEKIMAMPDVQQQIQEGLSKEAAAKKTYEEIKTKVGFDPIKDVSNFAIFTSGAIIEGQEPVAGAVIEGNYEIEKIINAIKADPEALKDVNVTVIDGFNAIVPKNSQDGYGLFLDNHFVTVGSQPGVDAVKKVKLGTAKSVENKKDFYAVLSKLDAKATVSGAGLLPKEFKEKCAQNPQAQFLSTINHFRFDFSNDNNMIFNLYAEVDDEKNVDNVMTQLGGYKAMIAMFAGSQAPEISEVVNQLNITKENTSVKLSLNIPADKLKELKEKIEERTKKLQEQSVPNPNAPRE